MELTQDRLKELLVYDPATGVFTNRATRCGRALAGDAAGCLHHTGYAQIGIDRKPYLAHRLAWLYVHGVWPAEIDHVNGVKTDNRLCNLREVTHKQNQENLGKYANNTSGFKGVVWHKPTSKWMSRIQHHGKDIYLGRFVNVEDARDAYLAANEKLFTHNERTSA